MIIAVMTQPRKKRTKENKYTNPARVGYLSSHFSVMSLAAQGAVIKTSHKTATPNQ